jgi:hypothetical protein
MSRRVSRESIGGADRLLQAAYNSGAAKNTQSNDVGMCIAHDLGG